MSPQPYSSVFVGAPYSLQRPRPYICNGCFLFDPLRPNCRCKPRPIADRKTRANLRFQDTTRKLRSKHFGATMKFPSTPFVYTESNASGRSPRMNPALQGEIHDGVVAVAWKGKTHRFHIFFRENRLLPRNASLRRSVYCDSVFRGDIVVMRKGANKDFVNIRSDDKRNINCAVKE